MNEDDDFHVTLERHAEKIRAQQKLEVAESLRHKPEWTYWKNLAVVRIDDAIVLSCDIDPGWHGDRKSISEVCRRKSIVESHLAAKSLQTQEPYKRVSGDAGDRLVTLSEFRRWGESLPSPLAFADEFPEALQRQMAESSKPMDTREKTTLLCIIGALAKEARLDISEPYKAGEVIAKLLLDTKLSSRTIGDHLKGVSEAMDSRKT